MLIDLHVHVAAEASGFPGNYASPVLHGPWNALLHRRLGLDPKLQGDALDQAYRDQLGIWLQESRLDQAVLLAMDPVYQRDGTRAWSQTTLAVDNDYVLELTQHLPKTRFGASVHPYRRDALDELERLSQHGACLIKWLPSTQGIVPDHPACFPFFERMAELGLPLLSHTGCEHTLGSCPNDLNDPRRLIPALHRGVKVIAAHCGVRLYLHEPCWFDIWSDMALTYPHFYGDLSAFMACTRMPALQAIMRSPSLTTKVLFGSDFPAPAWPVNLLGLFGLRRYHSLRRITNPLERALSAMEASQLPHSVFSQAKDLLPEPFKLSPLLTR